MAIVSISLDMESKGDILAIFSELQTDKYPAVRQLTPPYNYIHKEKWTN